MGFGSPKPEPHSDTLKALVEVVDAEPLTRPACIPRRKVQDWLKQVEWQVEEVQGFLVDIERYQDDFAEDVEAHLWLSDDFSTPAMDALTETRGQALDVLRRLEKVTEGFRALPTRKTRHDR